MSDDDTLPPLPAITPGRYRHFKGGEYELLDCVRHSETLQPLVLYRPLRGASGLWARPHAMFFEQVLVDGVWRPRFARMEPADDANRQTHLRPMTEAEFEAFAAEVVTDYAADKVSAGTWAADEALALSSASQVALLPPGLATPGHHHHSMVAADGTVVGALWFAEQQQAGLTSAYVYYIKVWSAHQRHGHGRRALLALEDEVRRLGLAGIALHVFGHNASAQALYAGLDYRPTDINLFKQVPPSPVRTAGAAASDGPPSTHPTADEFL